jgi:hypothetical protein
MVLDVNEKKVIFHIFEIKLNKYNLYYFLIML